MPTKVTNDQFWCKIRGKWFPWPCEHEKVCKPLNDEMSKFSVVHDVMEKIHEDLG